MKKLIFGNFKMNMDIKQTEEYSDGLLPKIANSKNEIAIFPPFTNLMFAKQKFTSSKVLLGAQNLSSEINGPFTGEVSASMLKNVGVNYVLVGHSERRKLFLEKNETLNKKIKMALSQGLKVVLCVGETKYERTNKKYKEVIEKEISEGLKGLYENELKNIIIAYEPVWAIGTGLVPNNKQIEEIAKIIREEISKEYNSSAGKNIKILYGGSVNSQNAKQFACLDGINGLLVGGASLKIDEFAKICNI